MIAPPAQRQEIPADDEYSVGGSPQPESASPFATASALLEPHELSRRISQLEEMVARQQRWLMRHEKRLNGVERVEGLR